MPGIRRLVEWYLGVVPAGPGEDSAWSFTLSPSRFGSAWWLWVLLACLACAAAVYLRETRAERGRMRWLLIGMRWGTLAVLVLLLSGVTLVVERTGLPFLAVMVDTSASMGLEDRYGDAALDARARQLVRDAGLEGASRLNVARALLLRDDGRLLRELQNTHQVRVYEFADAARLLTASEAELADGGAELRSAIEQLSPEGTETRPASALRNVLDDFRGMSPAAVVLLTDGISSRGDGEKLSAAADDARQRGVRLYPIGIGSSEPARDVQLYDVLADHVAFVNDPITFDFTVKGHDYEGESVRVTLRQGEGGAALASAEGTLGPSGTAVPMNITFTPSEEGDYEFVLEAAPLAGETNLDNNVQTRWIRVRRERIQVLLVERTPRWEFRHLKPALERDPTIELHTVLQESDVSYTQEDRTALPRFPVTQVELFRYDVVILGDVDVNYFNAGALDNLHEFVRLHGGGVIFVAGEGHNPLKYRGTPLEALLPVELEDLTVPTSAEALRSGFRPERTGAGRVHPILRLADEERANEDIWRELPESYWLLQAPLRKPGALVLAVHPELHTPDGRMPVIVLQRYGKGQALFHATDELWRWRRQVEDTFYARYWSQAVRALCRAKLLDGSQGVELTADRTVYDLGEAIRLRARFVDQRLLPPEGEPVSVAVERRGVGQELVRLDRSSVSPGVFEGSLLRAAAGAYHAWLASPALPDRPPACDFEVQAPDRERLRRAFDRADLIRAAKASGGEYVSFAEAKGLADRLPRGRLVPLARNEPIPLWSRWEWLLVFTGLLTAEWMLRKRSRLI
jgi:uncharacterized membrane protein